MVRKSAGPPAAAVKKFEERFGKTFGENTLKRTSKINPYEVISTGSLTLDYKLGVGGVVLGRCNEWWGPPNVGKSTWNLILMAQAQRQYPAKMGGWIDAEHKFDAAWAAAHGVDLDRLYVYTPESSEDVADAMKQMLTSDLFCNIVVDSIGAMIPEAEMEKDAGESAMGKAAGVITRMVKMAATYADKHGVSVNYINQQRANLSYGADTTTGGGFALKHCTTMKFKLRATGTPPYKVKIDGEDVQVGREIALVIERNGVAPAYKTAIVSLITVATEKYGPLGIDAADEAASMGILTKVVQQSGAWYTLPGGHRVNGKPALVEYLRTDDAMREAIRKSVLAVASGEILDEEIAPEDIPEVVSVDDEVVEVEEGTVNVVTGEVVDDKPQEGQKAPRLRRGMLSEQGA